jgi:hypothetical protein
MNKPDNKPTTDNKIEPNNNNDNYNNENDNDYNDEQRRSKTTMDFYPSTSIEEIKYLINHRNSPQLQRIQQKKNSSNNVLEKNNSSNVSEEEEKINMEDAVKQTISDNNEATVGEAIKAQAEPAVKIETAQAEPAVKVETAAPAVETVNTETATEKKD